MLATVSAAKHFVPMAGTAHRVYFGSSKLERLYFNAAKFSPPLSPVNVSATKRKKPSLAMMPPARSFQDVKRILAKDINFQNLMIY